MKDLSVRELRKLTPFLDERRLILKGYDKAANSLADYAEEGIVDRIGDGYFHNVLAGDLSVYESLNACIKLPILGHVSCLHMFGIITQIPRIMTVYVIDQENARSLDGVEYIHRDSRWVHEMAAKGGFNFAENKLPIRVLHPQLAHEDMVLTNDLSGLDPDDFDWELMEESFGVTFLFDPPDHESTFDISR